MGTMLGNVLGNNFGTCLGNFVGYFGNCVEEGFGEYIWDCLVGFW
jgi:hypothetical protein